MTMDKKAERLRRQYDDGIHIFQLPIEKELFLRFKADCILSGVTMKDRLADMIQLSLSD